VLSSVNLFCKNIRLMTKFDLLSKFKYLVENDSSKLKESAIVIRSLLKVEWWGKDKF